MCIGRIVALALILGPAAGFTPARQNPTPPELNPTLANPKHHRYSAEQAKTVALNAVEGTVVGDPVFKFDCGYWAYIVRVKGAKDIRRVWVDSDTGRIVGLDTVPGKKGDGQGVKNLKKQLDKKSKHPKKKKRKNRPPRSVIIIHG